MGVAIRRGHILRPLAVIDELRAMADENDAEYGLEHNDSFDDNDEFYWRSVQEDLARHKAAYEHHLAQMERDIHGGHVSGDGYDQEWGDVEYELQYIP